MEYSNHKAYTLSEFILIALLVVIFAGFMFFAYMNRAASKQAKEAEAFMRAVRYEQEDRCVAGRKYEVYSKRLKAFLKHKEGTKHFVYELSSGAGISARSKWHDYTLKMPSYADGRICCDNCEGLRRHYSPCALLKRRSDFIPADADCVVYPQKEETKSVTKTENIPSTQVTESAEVQPEPEVVPQQTQTTNRETVLTQPEETNSSPAAEEPAVEEQTPAQTSEQVATSPVSLCQAPQEKGPFYITQCDVYQPGTQGAVLFTWNEQTCQYDVTQNCLVPARWKSGKKITREEKEVYPSDVDKLCAQVLAQMGCAEQAAAGKECFEVNQECYSHCEVTDKKTLQESSTIVLYDVTLSLRKLQCAPSKNITVEIP